MTDMPMFPLGSVLFPYMPIPLRVFEERYLVMLSHVLQREPAEFGVVLIERGQEVGGGEKRFSYGTVAQITQLETTEGFVGLLAQGGRRIEIVDWHEDAPYPRADIRELDELEWDDELLPLREAAEVAVRRALTLAAELGDARWPADVELSPEPEIAVWQIAGIAPIGALDQVSLLGAESMQELLLSVVDLTQAVTEAMRAVWPDED